ncbi:MAG TPA: Uma2 family endonuclease [Pyrinomonadaceae bacterium]|nr:Uma2 family endonuclease [Pyrinomonadaceae bacterium]
MSTTQTHLMTAQELGNLPDEPHRHELIKGELLTMPLPKAEHMRVAANLTFLLMQHARANRLGQVNAEGGYKLESDPDTVLGPDVSFVSQDRFALSPEGYHYGPPDLAVEVLSPDDRRGRVEHKLSLWLEFGTRSVWLVNPRRRTVEVCKATGERILFHETDELSDDTVPGFRVKVSEIFV